MGYYTYISGNALIEPQIPEADWPDQWLPKPQVSEDYFAFEQIDGDEDVQIVNGQITVVGKTAGSTSANFRYDESIKGYDFAERLNILVEWAKQRGCTVNGTFYGDGEESEDFWCTNIVNNVIKTESGEITYPSDRYSEIAARGRAPRAHGNVIPRPDGMRAKCTGPHSCPECKAERDWLVKALYG